MFPVANFYPEFVNPHFRMHELSLASSMVEQIEAIMQEHGIENLDLVTVTIGFLSGVDPEAFEFAFPIATENTVLEGARLQIEHQPVEVRCRECSDNSSPEPLYMRCQACGSAAVDIISGRDFVLQSVEYTGSKALPENDSGLT